MCPELCTRRFVTSPVTHTWPTCFSSRRFTCAVSSATVSTLRVASGGKSSPKSHCDFTGPAISLLSGPVKSQWDFGELFPPEATRKVLTVAELTAQVKRLLEKQVGQVWVTGEVTNLRAQSSGHIYFTLEDAESQLNCVLFRGEARESRALLQDGRKVVGQGDLTVYEPRGQYQLRVTAGGGAGVGG